jgi:two-component system, NtrC family, response regulator PilR
MNYMPLTAAVGTFSSPATRSAALRLSPPLLPESGMACILLVEDDPNVMMLLEHVLRGEGHDVDTATTVEQACSRLRQSGGYNLVVADGKLPDGTGMQVGEAASVAGTKTLIVTGFAFQLPREELSKYVYLLKPVRPAEFLRAIDRMLESSTRPTASPQ